MERQQDSTCVPCTWRRCIQVSARMYFKPLTRSRFRVMTHIQAFMLLSRSRSWLHQQLLKQQLAPWNVTSEVSTSDPSFKVEFLGPRQNNFQREDATSACSTRKEVQNLVMLSLVLSTVYAQETEYGGEKFYLLCARFRIRKTVTSKASWIGAVSSGRDQPWVWAGERRRSREQWNEVKVLGVPCRSWDMARNKRWNEHFMEGTTWATRERVTNQCNVVCGHSVHVCTCNVTRCSVHTCRRLLGNWKLRASEKQLPERWEKKAVGITSCCVVQLCHRFPCADHVDLKKNYCSVQVEDRQISQFCFDLHLLFCCHCEDEDELVEG